MAMLYETVNGMRIETFLATDPIAPFENRKIGMLEKEKEELRKEILELMYEDEELPE